MANPYRYDHLSFEAFVDDMTFAKNARSAGETLPDFELPTVDGTTLSRADLEGTPALVVFGSKTCPMTIAALPFLRSLHRTYGERVLFVLLYVHEAHPGERVLQPRALDEKVEHARAFGAETDVPFTIAVDTIDGDLHRALDDKPNAVFLVDREGRIAFRALWASDRAIETALEQITQGKAPAPSSSQARFVPILEGLGVMHAVFDRAGPRAERDLWRVAPSLAVLSRLAAPFTALPPAWRAPAGAAIVALAIAMLWIVVD